MAPRVWVQAERYLELVTECEILEREIAPGANAGRDGSERVEG